MVFKNPLKIHEDLMELQGAPWPAFATLMTLVIPGKITRTHNCFWKDWVASEAFSFSLLLMSVSSSEMVEFDSPCKGKCKIFVFYSMLTPLTTFIRKCELKKWFLYIEYWGGSDMCNNGNQYTNRKPGGLECSRIETPQSTRKFSCF